MDSKVTGKVLLLCTSGAHSCLSKSLLVWINHQFSKRMAHCVQWMLLRDPEGLTSIPQGLLSAEHSTTDQTLWDTSQEGSPRLHLGVERGLVTKTFEYSKVWANILVPSGKIPMTDYLPLIDYHRMHLKEQRKRAFLKRKLRLKPMQVLTVKCIFWRLKCPCYTKLPGWKQVPCIYLGILMQAHACATRAVQGELAHILLTLTLPA